MSALSQFLIAGEVICVRAVFINARLAKPASAGLCLIAAIFFLAAMVTP
jgi:hypothetical protein